MLNSVTNGNVSYGYACKLAKKRTEGTRQTLTQTLKTMKTVRFSKPTYSSSATQDYYYEAENADITYVIRDEDRDEILSRDGVEADGSDILVTHDAMKDIKVKKEKMDHLVLLRGEKNLMDAASSIMESKKNAEAYTQRIMSGQYDRYAQGR